MNNFKIYPLNSLITPLSFYEAIKFDELYYLLISRNYVIFLRSRLTVLHDFKDETSCYESIEVDLHMINYMISATHKIKW